jgi:hypothetical protein
LRGWSRNDINEIFPRRAQHGGSRQGTHGNPWIVQSPTSDTQGKLSGQISLIAIEKHYLADDGSFTFTSDVFADEPLESVPIYIRQNKKTTALPGPWFALLMQLLVDQKRCV